MITLYWNRTPGKFVNKSTGKEYDIDPILKKSGALGPTFDGSVREWYETLVETCIDARNRCVRDGIIPSLADGARVQLRAGTNAFVMIETSVLYQPDGTLGSLFHVNQSQSVAPNEVVLCDMNTKKAIATVKVIT